MSLIAMALVGAGVGVAALAEPHLAAELTPREITVGDRVEVTLTLTVDDRSLTIEPHFPSWEDTWGEAAILEVGEVQPLADAPGYRQRVILTAFRPGEIRLPPPTVELPLGEETLEVTTERELALQVRSVLPPGEQLPEAKPPTPPRSLASGVGFWWTAGLLAMGCLAAAVALARRQALTLPSEAAVPPLTELIQGLEEADGADGALAAHTLLSRALRHYLGRTLAFPACESTTTEIHRCLLAHDLPRTWVHDTVELLRACDRVKFAREDVKRPVFRERRVQTQALGEALQELLQRQEEREA